MMRRSEILGPVVGWEFHQLVRSRGWRRIRVGIILILLVVQLLFFLNYFEPNAWPALLGTEPLTIAESAEFGQSFTITFLITQAVLLGMVATALGSSLSDETSRHRFDLLKLTPLSSRELALGMMLPALAMILSVAMIGFPIAAISILYGGTSLNWLIGYYFATISGVILVAVLCFYFNTASEYSGDTQLSRRYRRLSLLSKVLAGITFVPCFGLNYSPYLFAGIAFILAVLLFLASVPFIRLPPYRQIKPPANNRSNNAGPIRQLMTRPEPKLDTTNTYLWQAWVQHRRQRTSLNPSALPIVLWIVLIWKVGSSLLDAYDGIERGNLGRTPLMQISYWILFFGAGYTLNVYLTILSITSVSVSRERIKGTLDLLLLIPDERHTLLWGKWCTALRLERNLGLLALAIVLFAAMLPGATSWAVLLVAGQSLAFLLFVNTLALWLSIRTNGAPLLCQFIGIILLIAPWLFAPLLGPYHDCLKGMSVAVSWYEVIHAGRFPSVYHQIGSALAMLLSLFGAWRLWLDAVRRFERRD